MDRASNFQKSKARLILRNLGVVVEYVLRFLFRATNNQAKYETLLVGLKIAKELGVKGMRVFTYLSQ